MFSFDVTNPQLVKWHCLQKPKRYKTHSQTNQRTQQQQQQPKKLARQNHSIVSNDVDASLYNGCWFNRWWKNCHHKHAHKSTMPFGNTDQVHGAQSKSTLPLLPFGFEANAAE